jgi:hypothetical protein
VSIDGGAVGASTVTANGINAAAGTINLSSGDQLNITNSILTVSGGAVTNNGTLSISNNSQFRSGAGTVAIDGTGGIFLDNSLGSVRIGDGGGGFAFGSGQTVTGSGQIGVNQAILTNNGVISATVAIGGISLDAAGGNGGVGAGNGVGTGGNAGMFNTGTLQATGGSTLSFEGGLYENSATGVIAALNGSIVSLNNDARLLAERFPPQGAA